MGLDTNYKATEQEKTYVKETVEKEGVASLFTKEFVNLSQKIIRNFHTENYVLFETKNIFSSEKESMKAIINADPEIKNKYEQAYNKNKNKPGFSEGILLLQAIAIKCVNIINQSELVEQKLSSWNDKTFKSQAMDGILGPNTFYVLASIAKEKGIPFNGVVDKELLNTMINICGIPTTDNTQNNTVQIDNNHDHQTNKPSMKEKKDTKLTESSHQTTQETQQKNNTIRQPQTRSDIDTDVNEVIQAINVVNQQYERYPNRSNLSPEEQQQVKHLYIQIMQETNLNNIQNILNTIDNLKILQGLQDLFVKKILMLKKQNANTEKISYVQSIAQMIVNKQNEILIIKQTHTISSYTITPSPFTLEKTTDTFNSGTINFMLKYNGKELGIIGFDSTGQLLTTTLTKNNITYTITQSGNTLTITQETVTQPAAPTPHPEEEIPL